MNYSVTKHGKPLDKSLYSFDEKTLVFSTKEDNLVLDFTSVDGITFYTCSNCNFQAGSHCTFKTGYKCTFNTGSYCKFNTGYKCTFNTGSYCKFNTSSYCTFNTDACCAFSVHVNFNITLVERVTITLISYESTKVYNLNDYYHKNIKGLCLNNEEIDRLHEFDLNNPRSTIIQINDPLGKKLFEHFKKTKVL